jgi:hypothetical protein
MASTHCIPETDEIINSLKELAQHATKFSETLNAAVRKNDGQGNGGEVEAAAVENGGEAVPAAVEEVQPAVQPAADAVQEPAGPAAAQSNGLTLNQQRQAFAQGANEQPAAGEGEGEGEGAWMGGRSHKRRMHKRNKTHRKKVRTIRKKNKRTHWRR